MQNLQQQLNTTSGDYGRLLDLFSAFQSGSDHEATTLLARLRLGESIDSLLTTVPSNQASRSRCVSFLSVMEAVVLVPPNCRQYRHFR